MPISASCEASFLISDEARGERAKHDPCQQISNQRGYPKSVCQGPQYERHPDPYHYGRDKRGFVRHGSASLPYRVRANDI